MIDLTIAIVTNRDYKKFLKPTIDMIKSYPNPYKVKYEIIVFGPAKLFVDRRIDRFYEEIGDQGNLFGYNYLTWNAKGRNIAYLTDDMYFSDNFFEVSLFLDNLKSRRLKVAGFNCGPAEINPFPYKKITENVSFTSVSISELLYFVKYHYGPSYKTTIPMPRFLAAQKQSIMQYMQGYLFHPSLFHSAGDIYLSIWAWIHNQTIYEDIPVRISPRVVESYTQHRENDAKTVTYLINKLALGNYFYI